MMNKQAFTEANLTQVLRTRKSHSKHLYKKTSNLTLLELSNKIAEGTYNITDFSMFNLKGNIIYETSNLEDEIVLSKLNNNIKYIYNVKQSDRHTIVKQIISLLKEETPKYLYKLDISSFYESINLNYYGEILLNDNILSSESCYVLSDLLRVTNKQNINGLPRGIGLSATLSELAMRDFDKELKSNKKIYFFSRFVDDILIFSSERLDVKNDIIKYLPPGLKLNWGKTKFLKVVSCFCSGACICNKVKCDCWDKCKCSKKKDEFQNFSFLGYEFNFIKLCSVGMKNKISIDISLSKVNKLKNRLFLSFDNYHKNGNYKLLENRVRFLTGNHYISNGKHRTERMKSGVHYNYIHITTISKYAELDLYLKKLIFANSASNIKLSVQHKHTLNKFSFVSGFNNKLIEKFSGNQINKIKGCWNRG